MYIPYLEYKMCATIHAPGPVVVVVVAVFNGFDFPPDAIQADFAHPHNETKIFVLEAWPKNLHALVGCESDCFRA